MYAFRKIRDTFKKNKSLTDQVAIKKEMEYGLKNFNIIKRQVCANSVQSLCRFQISIIKLSFQVLIGNLYSADKLVIEK